VAAAIAADVTDENQLVELVAAVNERLGYVDVLVVNATGPAAHVPVAAPPAAAPARQRTVM